MADSVASLRLAPAEEVALTLLQQRLTAECMRAKGFDYALPDPDVVRHEIDDRNLGSGGFPLNPTDPQPSTSSSEASDGSAPGWLTPGV